MDIKILSPQFIELTVVENYQSFIWTERYNQYGDFELYAPTGSEWMRYIEIGNYVVTTDSDRMMIIENLEVTTDIENGTFAKITGRSLESILARRIVWVQTIIESNVQAVIKKVITDAIINPTLTARRIPNFIFSDTTDRRITKYSIEAQYTGDNVYTVVSDICQQIGAGFKVTLNENKQFVFKLFMGEDRSDSVIFSNEFNNLLTSDYKNTYENYCNVTLVAGEGEGSARKTAVVGSASGLNRRELYTDARDLSSSGTTAAKYLNQLKQRGNEKLAEKKLTEGFQGTVVPDIMYQYGVDFNIGDFVLFRDTFGNEGRQRIDEFIISHDEGNGYYTYPTFVTVEE